jgi:hypothetical protein
VIDEGLFYRLFIETQALKQLLHVLDAHSP